ESASNRHARSGAKRLRTPARVHRDRSSIELAFYPTGIYVGWISGERAAGSRRRDRSRLASCPGPVARTPRSTVSDIGTGISPAWVPQTGPKADDPTCAGTVRKSLTW